MKTGTKSKNNQWNWDHSRISLGKTDRGTPLFVTGRLEHEMIPDFISMTSVVSCAKIAGIHQMDDRWSMFIGKSNYNFGYLWRNLAQFAENVVFYDYDHHRYHVWKENNHWRYFLYGSNVPIHFQRMFSDLYGRANDLTITEILQIIAL